MEGNNDERKPPARRPGEGGEMHEENNIDEFEVSVLLDEISRLLILRDHGLDDDELERQGHSVALRRLVRILVDARRTYNDRMTDQALILAGRDILQAMLAGNVQRTTIGQFSTSINDSLRDEHETSARDTPKSASRAQNMGRTHGADGARTVTESSQTGAVDPNTVQLKLTNEPASTEEESSQTGAIDTNIEPMKLMNEPLGEFPVPTTAHNSNDSSMSPTGEGGGLHGLNISDPNPQNSAQGQKLANTLIDIAPRPPNMPRGSQGNRNSMRSSQSISPVRQPDQEKQTYNCGMCGVPKIGHVCRFLKISGHRLKEIRNMLQNNLNQCKDVAKKAKLKNLIDTIEESLKDYVDPEDQGDNSMNAEAQEGSAEGKNGHKCGLCGVKKKGHNCRFVDTPKWILPQLQEELPENGDLHALLRQYINAEKPDDTVTQQPERTSADNTTTMEGGLPTASRSSMQLDSSTAAAEASAAVDESDCNDDRDGESEVNPPKKKRTEE